MPLSGALVTTSTEMGVKDDRAFDIANEPFRIRAAGESHTHAEVVSNSMKKIWRRK
jgi:hypothetical protein